MGLASDLQEPAFVWKHRTESRDAESRTQEEGQVRTYYVRRESCLCIATCGIELIGGVVMWLLEEEQPGRPERHPTHPEGKA